MNKNIHWAVSTAAAAAVIGAGVALYPDEKSVATSPIDDVGAIEIAVPTVAQLEIDALGAPPANTDDITPQAADVVVDKNANSINVSSITDDIPRYAALLKEQEYLLTDQRSRIYDPTLGKLDSASWAKWAKIFIDPAVLKYIPKFKPLQTGLKIISEVRCPASSGEMKTLTRRLADYRRKKFNAVLLCFDTTEDLTSLAATADYIRGTGMRIIMVYVGGRENLRAPVFRDPDRIAEFIRCLAPKSDAILTGHWRTSVHLYLPDKAYTNYIIMRAREANPEIGIIGQAYWGQTAATGTEEKDFTTTISLPENSSAVLVVGLGYPGTASEKNLKKLFSAVADFPHKIGLVVGEKPYFSSTRDTGKSRYYNELLKRQLERKLLKAGCQSTLTFSADGSNRSGSSENLCWEYN